jgi:parallel beta-helix repeat protein
MKRKCLAVGIILLFVGTCIIPAIAQDTQKTQPASRGNWLYVGGSGPGNYTTIQSAISAAESFDTVFVYSGIYYEDVTIMFKDNITLLGEDKNTTIINANKISTVLTVGANNCSVSGFTLINCRRAYNDWDAAVVCVTLNGNIIENNIISCYHMEYNDDMGAIDLRGSYNKIIRNRVFEEKTAGRLHGIVIHSSSNYNIISENNITNYWVAGILIYLNSDYNIISGNYIHDNQGVGIWDWGESTIIINNTISRNGVGIECEIGSHSIIYNNIIQMNSGCGITLSWAPKSNGATYYNVSQNLISDNPTGLYILDSYYNTIGRNDFINNSVNAYFIYENIGVTHNTWTRNYWSDLKLGVLRKFIHGKKAIGGFIIYLNFPWFNIDWHPSETPYDIGV